MLSSTLTADFPIQPWRIARFFALLIAVQPLARAEKASVAKKPIEWKSASSCYEHVRVAIAKAMIASMRGDAAGAKTTLAQARKAFEQVPQKSVRKECDDQLAEPGDPQWWASAIARHAGLPS